MAIVTETREEGGFHCWRAIICRGGLWCWGGRAVRTKVCLVCLTPGAAADRGVVSVRWRAGPAAVRYNGDEQAEWGNGGLAAGRPKPEESCPKPSHGTASEGFSVGWRPSGSVFVEPDQSFFFFFFLSPISCPSSSLHLLSLTSSVLLSRPYPQFCKLYTKAAYYEVTAGLSARKAENLLNIPKTERKKHHRKHILSNNCSHIYHKCRWSCTQRETLLKKSSTDPPGRGTGFQPSNSVLQCKK